MLNSLTVASMAPNITESIFFLELDSMLIGRTLYCDFPKEAESIEIIGTFIEMNYEKMLILNPDIIVFSGNLTSKERKFLEENKIQYADVKMERAEDVIPAIMRIDSLLSNSSHREKIDSLKNSLSFSALFGVKGYKSVLNASMIAKLFKIIFLVFAGSVLTNFQTCSLSIY